MLHDFFPFLLQLNIYAHVIGWKPVGKPHICRCTIVQNKIIGQFLSRVQNEHRNRVRKRSPWSLCAFPPIKGNHFL